MGIKSLVTENMEETMCVFVCEQTSDWFKPKITLVQEPGVFFCRFDCRIQTYNRWNRNNRNYFLEPMKQSWASPHIKELETRGDFFGEAGHPISDNPKRILTIDPKLACHRIIRHWFEGESVYGTFETLNDDMYGLQFTKHLLQKCEAAVSLRAMVPLRKIDAIRQVVRQKGYIITVDRVILPSHDDAYMLHNGTVEIIKGAALESTMPVIPEGNTCDDTAVAVLESTSFINYLQDESFNLKTVMDHFEVVGESITVDKNFKFITVQEAAQPDGSRRTAIIKTDDFLRAEVSDIFRSLR